MPPPIQKRVRSMLMLLRATTPLRYYTIIKTRLALFYMKESCTFQEISEFVWLE